MLFDLTKKLLNGFCVAHMKYVAQSDLFILFVHESGAPVSWSCKPPMYALWTYFGTTG